MAASNSAFQRRYPPEMRERAVRTVRETIAESSERVGAVTRANEILKAAASFFARELDPRLPKS